MSQNSSEISRRDMAGAAAFAASRSWPGPNECSAPTIGSASPSAASAGAAWTTSRIMPSFPTSRSPPSAISTRTSRPSASPSMEKMGIARPKTYVDIRKLLDDKEHRRHLHRHAESLARADGHLGLPGGQGRLRREAVLAQSLGRPATGEGGAASTTASCSTARRSARPPRFGKASRRSTTATWARSTWRAASASNGATRSAAPLRKPVPAGVDYDLWTGPAPVQSVHEQSFSLQLALELYLRQRRHGQPGRPPVGHGALGAGARSSRTRCRPSAATSCSTTTRTRPTIWCCAFEFDPPDGKRRMIIVRGAALDDESPKPASARRTWAAATSNPIGNIFFGSKGYMSTGDEGRGYLQSLARQGAAAAAQRDTRATKWTTSRISSIA